LLSWWTLESNVRKSFLLIGVACGLGCAAGGEEGAARSDDARDAASIDSSESESDADSGGASPDTVSSATPVDAGNGAAGREDVITWAEIEAGFVGTFVVPSSEQEGTEFRFGFSHGVHTQLDNGNLLLSGHTHYPQVAEVQLPEVFDGSEASRVGDWFDVTGGLEPTAWTDGESYVLGGMLAQGERVYFSKHQWYNATADDWDSQGYYEGGVAHGMWNVAGEGAHSQRVGGYLCAAPAALAAEGATYLAGQQGASGAATGRWGPNLFAIQFDEEAPTGTELGSLPLIYHPNEGQSAPGWWVGDRVSAALWLETDDKHAVLFFLIKGLGETWYGEAVDGPDGGNPYGGSKGYHAQGWSLEVWIYDPAELLLVSRGERDPWSLEPVEQTALIQRLPGSSTETHPSFLTGPANTPLQASLRGGRLLLIDPAGNMGEFENMPKGYVLEL
jgi:hypothetical protein